MDVSEFAGVGAAFCIGWDEVGAGYGSESVGRRIRGVEDDRRWIGSWDEGGASCGAGRFKRWSILTLRGAIGRV